MNWKRYASAICLLVILAAALTGCGLLGAPEPTATPAPTDVPPTPTEMPSPTPEPPTATPTAEPPTATPEPTATPVPEKVEAWCLPLEFAGVSLDSAKTAVMPSGARPATLENGQLNLMVPAVACTFVYTSSQPLPAGTQLLFFDPGQSKPWLTTTLESPADAPNVGLSVINHTFVLNPPYWEISYVAEIRGADGTQKWASPLRVYKGKPPLCWNFQLPDPITLACPSIDGDWHVYETPVN